MSSFRYLCSGIKNRKIDGDGRLSFPREWCLSGSSRAEDTFAAELSAEGAVRVWTPDYLERELRKLEEILIEKQEFDCDEARKFSAMFHFTLDANFRFKLDTASLKNIGSPKEEVMLEGCGLFFQIKSPDKKTV